MKTFTSVIGRMIPFLILLISRPTFSEDQPFKRIMTQDSTLNNLVDPPGYQTSKPGTLVQVVKMGKGTQPVILIPGLGFGGSVFAEFMEGFADNYRMYAITLPGFGGTAAPPCPAETTSFGKQTWTNAALVAIENLMKEENI